METTILYAISFSVLQHSSLALPPEMELHLWMAGQSPGACTPHFICSSIQERLAWLRLSDIVNDAAINVGTPVSVQNTFQLLWRHSVRGGWLTSRFRFRLSENLCTFW